MNQMSVNQSDVVLIESYSGGIRTFSGMWELVPYVLPHANPFNLLEACRTHAPSFGTDPSLAKQLFDFAAAVKAVYDARIVAAVAEKLTERVPKVKV